MRSFTRPACCRCASERHSNRTTSASSMRSEEHTSELQSRLHLVCRLLLEKKKKHNDTFLVRHQRAYHAPVPVEIVRGYPTNPAHHDCQVVAPLAHGACPPRDKDAI